MDLLKRINALKADIIKAFDGTIYPGDDKLLHPSGQDDSDIVCFYGRTNWQNVHNRVIEHENAALSGFSPEAFHFFLPRFLIYALENYNSEEPVLDNLIYALSPEYYGDASHTKSFLRDHGEELEPQLKKDMEDIVLHLESTNEEEKLKALDFRISKYRKLTFEQKQVIVSFLELIMDEFTDYFNEKVVNAALDYWHKETRSL